MNQTKPISTKQAADEIGCDTSTVTRWARHLGFQNKFGNALALTKTQVNAIKRAWKKRAGNPNFGKTRN
jgi:DNA-binding MurR/RpiR family transcriptional regulator